MRYLLGPMRDVVGTELFRAHQCNRNALGTRILRLECGHQTSQKGSRPVPKRAHCPNCRSSRPDTQAA